MILKKVCVILFVTIAQLGHAQVPSYVPTNGLKGYWPFCNNANDISGNGANGTVSGAVLTNDRFNSANSAYNFNGSSSYISTVMIGILSNNPRAVSFWAKTTNGFSTMCGVSWGDEQSNPNYGVRWECAFNYGSPGATIIGADCAITYATPSPVNNGNWHHYVYQYSTGADWTSVQIYQDAVLLTTVLHTHNPQAPINTSPNWPVNFGRIPYFIPHYFQGDLDDIGIWNRVLTTAEIQALYQAQNSSSSITITASSTTICSGASVSLTASGASSYTWNTSATTASIVVNPTISTMYSVIGNGSGCGAGAQNINITVSPGPTVLVNSSANTICPGQTVNLTASGATSYTWSSGATSSSILVTPNANSVYTVTGFGSSTFCNSTKTVGINVLASPAITISGNTGICGGGTLTLVANGADSYTWNTSSLTNSISVSPTITTAYSVIGISAATGCTAQIATTVTLSSIPQLSATSTSVCSGQSTTLAANGAITYTWNTGDVAQTITVSPTANTIYTVSGSGSLPSCIGTKTVEVIVLPAPILTVSSSSAAICIGKPVTFSVSGADFYIWSNGTNGEIITVNPLATSVYSVVGSITNMNCTSTRNISVTVHPPANIYITYDSLACDQDPIELKAQGAANYVWNTTQTTSAISTVMEENKIYSVNGTDPLTGCPGSGSVEINPSGSCCEIFIPNSFTPNDDGINELFGPKTLCKFSSYKFVVYNRWGQKIFESNDPKKHWDGTYKDKESPGDIYVYLLEAERSGKGLISTERYLNLKGHVTLFR